MTKDNKNIIVWIAGIILFVLIAMNVPNLSQFAIIQETVCEDGVLYNWNMDGNSLDTKGLANGLSNNVSFVNGKAEFNKLNYINFPVTINDNLIMVVKNYSAGDTTYFYLAKINGTSYVNGVESSSKQISVISENFGLGENMSVDSITAFSNLTKDKMLNFYNGGNFVEACYKTTRYENVTCKEYYEATVSDKSTGCLNYTGSLFPNCSYTWDNQTTYQIENNACKKNFYCQSSCLESGGCYTTNQKCIEGLEYDCYVFANNQCSKKTDYASCKINTSNTYTTLANCQTKITTSTTTTTTTTTTSTEEEFDFQELASREIWNIGGFSITPIHLFILLILIIGLIYVLGGFK
jgi:hypothetical protein